MKAELEAIVRTRATAAAITAEALQNIEGASEFEFAQRILAGVEGHRELFPGGWYDPPPRGVAVLFGDNEHRRTQFETLRVPEFWPNEKYRFQSESVGMIYFSPVDKATGMFGDIGFSVYRGKSNETKQHLEDCLKIVNAVAECAEVGMRFCDLYTEAQAMFRNKAHKHIAWMTTTHDLLKINLGHTVPGSYSDDTPLGATFEETKESIRTRRIYINEAEQFVIPETCAFTVEARLVDAAETQPNVFFHVIVVFSDGKKTILTNFDDIFKALGMDYML
ncbi:MAG: M24 family metallopeptidase [Patescibacteria group bacterium]|mgnify:FL=1